VAAIGRAAAALLVAVCALLPAGGGAADACDSLPRRVQGFAIK
jgi:hypothetical protein